MSVRTVLSSGGIGQLASSRKRAATVTNWVLIVSAAVIMLAWSLWAAACSMAAIWSLKTLVDGDGGGGDLVADVERDRGVNRWRGR
jgi:hypothetical protein